MQTLIPANANGNLIATIAIGEKCLSDWKTFALPSWQRYCERHACGLVVFDSDLIAKDAPTWKKPTWQKLLIAETLRRKSGFAGNVCYLDTDILINDFAPSIFEGYDPTKIGLVSLRTALPFPYHDVLRRLAFLRHTHFDSSYPLDSALFMTLEQLYGYHSLPVQADEACMGLILFNVNSHAALMQGWFNKYDASVESVTNGGDQTHVNYEIQSWGHVQWLDYRFQAIWVFEMACKYPFLYNPLLRTPELEAACIDACLYANYFLHFAGSWHESTMWRNLALESDVLRDLRQTYHSYRNMKLTGAPRGLSLPAVDKNGG